MKQIRDKLNEILEEIQTVDIPTVFREVINGMFQAEGYIGGRFRKLDSYDTKPQIAFSQLVSEQSLKFIVIAYRALRNTGTFRITVTSTRKFHIILVTHS